MAQEIQDAAMAEATQRTERQKMLTDKLNQIQKCSDDTLPLQVDDGGDLIPALVDDLRLILNHKEATRVPALVALKKNQQLFKERIQEVQKLLLSASRLQVDNGHDYLPMLALMEDVNSICNGEKAVRVPHLVATKER